MKFGRQVEDDIYAIDSPAKRFGIGNLSFNDFNRATEVVASRGGANKDLYTKTANQQLLD